MYEASAKPAPRERRWRANDGLLRQTKTHHLQAIPLLTASDAVDVMRVPTVITGTVGEGGAVHGLQYPRKESHPNFPLFFS